MNASNQQFDNAQQDGLAQIASLQAELSSPSRTTSNPTDQAAAVRSKVAAAQAAANRVAAGQNVYGRLVKDAAAHASTADGSSATPAEQAVAAHRVQLASAWSPRSFLVSGIAADSYSPSDPFSAGQIDPRWPWYVRYDAAVPSTAESYGWVVDTVVLDPSGTTASVIWRNLQRSDAPGTPKGTILAWAKATYDIGVGTFSKLTVTTSNIGAAHLSPTLIYSSYAGSDTPSSSSSAPSVPLPALPTGKPSASSTPSVSATPSTPTAQSSASTKAVG